LTEFAKEGQEENRNSAGITKGHDYGS
jgi:hypothetical protein